MASYNPTTNFAAKDTLPAGDPSKIIRGTDFSVEFDAISTAINDIPESIFVNVKDYGATGDGVTDDTAAIQSAINYASNNGIEDVFIPSGHYKFSVLRMYHDATDNPNFIESPNRDGRVNLVGEGRLAANNLKFMTSGFTGLYGTVLESTGDGIIVDPTAAFDDTDARKFEMSNLTVVADNTGYVVTSNSCPQFTLIDVAIKQLNTAGSGLYIKNGWFTTLDRVQVYGPSDTGEVSTSTGSGIVGATDFFAGLWNIQNSSIDHFSNGVRWDEGQFVNVCIRDTAIQDSNQYNFYGDGGVIFNLKLDNVYFENVNTQGVNFIKSDNEKIRVLEMSNCFMLGGNAGTARTTGAAIEVEGIEALNIRNHYVFRPRQTFLNVISTVNNQNVSGVIENSIFTTDEDLSAEPTIYLLEGIIPNVHNCVWPAMSQGVHNTSGDIRLYDETVSGKYLRHYTDISGATGITKLSFGDTEQVTATSPYRLSGAGIEEKTYYDLTHTEASGLAVYMPAPSAVKSDGRVIIIRNNENTASAYPFINVFISSATPPADRLAQLNVGQSAMFVFDGKGTNGSDWKCVGIWDGGDSSGSILTVAEDAEDVKITGTVPALEWVESDNGDARVRYAVNNGQLVTSMYGSTTGTFGGITHQSRDGTDSHVVYTYDPSNDYHWWGTRTAGTQLLQLSSAGNLTVGTIINGDLARMVTETDSAYTAGLEIRSAGLGGNEWARMNLQNQEGPANNKQGIIYFDQDGHMGIRNNNSSGTAKQIRLIGGDTTAGSVGFFATAVGSEVIRMDSDGIKFNGDTAAANALDDYEEGTFTPVFIGTTTAGSGTYTTQDGVYTKIGRLVTFSINIVRSGVTVAPAGNLRLGGLPFTASSSNTSGGCSINYAANFGATNAPSGGTVTVGNSQIILRNRLTDDARNAILAATSASGIGVGVQMTVSGFYYTD